MDDERARRAWIEAVKRVGFYQGYAGAPALVAAHWGSRLRRA